MNYAYATLLSSKDYLLGVLVLNANLKAMNSKYPLIVGVTENIFNKNLAFILEQEQIKYKIIQPLYYNQNAINLFTSKSIENTASKIQLFSFKEYDKIVYLDCDSLMLQNIDELFNYPNGAMLKYPQSETGMSGLFVYTPKTHNEEYYKYLIQHFNTTDGGLLGNLFFPAQDNPSYQISEYYFINDLNIQPEYKGIHYGLGPEWKKPFLIKSTYELKEYYKYPAYKEYFKYMLPLKSKYGL